VAVLHDGLLRETPPVWRFYRRNLQCRCRFFLDHRPDGTVRVLKQPLREPRV
jgi:hypothetical protein